MVLKKTFSFFYLSFFLSLNLFASTDSTIFFSQLLKGGESFRADYTGPLSPHHINNTDSFYANYPQQLFFPDILQLETPLDKISKAMGCSDFSMNHSFEYGRYLFRLITISYLFENLKMLRARSLQLGGFPLVCPMGQKIFSECIPKYQEMKKFISRISPRIDEWSFVTAKIWGNEEIQSFIKKINSHSDYPELDDLSLYRIQKYCIKNKNCPKNVPEILSMISILCKMDARRINNLCSETDEIMGLSQIPEALKLLLESNAVSVINSLEDGAACLGRFSKELQKKEKVPDYFSGIYKIIDKKISADPSRRYKQGQLFLPGALKEFDDKGLADFLFVSPKPKPVAVVIKKITPLIPTPFPTPPVQTPVQVVKAPVAPVVIPPTPPSTTVEILKSQFYLAAKQRLEMNLDQVVVDMNKFKKEFSIEGEELKNYKAIFETYQEREALLSMKEQDKLGSENEPFRLIFLKYLLDQKNHQGLFNVQAVIGEKFYVINDIDQTLNPEYIQLKSGAKNNIGWEIVILKPLSKGEVKSSPLNKGTN